MNTREGPSTDTKDTMTSPRYFDAARFAAVQAGSNRLFDNKPTTSSLPVFTERATKASSLVSRFADSKGRANESSMFASSSDHFQNRSVLVIEVGGVNLNWDLPTLSRLSLARLTCFWYDPDVQESIRTLLADIAAARDRPLPSSPTNPFSSSTPFKTLPPSLWDSQPLNRPFNPLTSATIPTPLNKYLKFNYPPLFRLVCPRLHYLPEKLSTEYVS
ncbi:hypothetical protein BJ165DRAFT_1529377 [Panaeolus papilionaceus]|nr:hypothetical protein BJ165DRAFT_1529377 [Panaeolus papilionaceus]